MLLVIFYCLELFGLVGMYCKLYHKTRTKVVHQNASQCYYSQKVSVKFDFKQKGDLRKRRFSKWPYVTFNDLWGQTSYKVLKRSDFEQKGYLGRSGILNIKLTFNGLWGHTSLFKNLRLHRSTQRRKDVKTKWNVEELTFLIRKVLQKNIK